MAIDNIDEIQTFLQMYDKGLVSKKTILEKVDIVWEEEKVEIEKDRKYDEELWTETMKQKVNKAGGEV